jgi:probable HAF family extracellular repeat protein
MKNVRVGLLVLCLGSLLCCPAVFADQYQFIDLGFGTPLSINNNGQIVGTNNNHATLFDSTGAGNSIDLGTLSGYSDGTAKSINNNGQIAGYVNEIVGGSGYSRATLFDSSGMGNNIDLGTVQGGTWSRAFSINNNGHAVGCSDGAPYGIQAAFFNTSGTGNVINLGSLPNIQSAGYMSEADSINDYDQIVGKAVAIGGYHATLFDKTGAGNNIDLGTLSGKSESGALSINNNGQIVGYATDINNNIRAVLFDPTGAKHNIDLGYGRAFSINSNGQAVGFSDHGATFFDVTGAGNNIALDTLVSLPSGWSLHIAYSINDNGWIVGEGYYTPAGSSQYEYHAFLLKPIPEPGSLMLLLAGAGLFRLRRRA